MRLTLLLCVLLSFLFVNFGCRKEISESEIDQIKNEYAQQIFERTTYKPGPPEYDIGVVGGVYYSYVQSDPKSFNTLNARDGFTAAVTDMLYPYLFSYDPYEKEFKPDLAMFDIMHDTENEQTTVTITLRDDVYWTTANGGKVKITVDDVIYWYNEIEGDRALQNPGYPGQFMTTKEGEKKRIILEKIDERSARFVMPVISANPLLYVNTTFGPRYIFQPAKESNGVSGVLDVLSIDMDPKDVPSAGKYLLYEYKQGQRITFIRNPDYWGKDDAGNALPYIEKIVMRIIASQDAALLSFKQGDLSSYNARPEDIDSLLTDQESYDVYSAGASLDSMFITFNQRPEATDAHKTAWFSNTQFRQAMSALLPRMRIVNEVFRGLAEPAHHFFAKANMFYDESISLQYRYNPTHARELLEQIDFSVNEDGRMIDTAGNLIEFDIFVGVESTVGQDIVNVFADELDKVGITLNVKPIDFQNLVERLTKSYSWDSVIVGLGANYWPSSGSNVWQSNGNFHLWNPLQQTPATQWEAQIDELYQVGLYTIDEEERKKIYDEYQRILLEQLPLLYVVHSINFVAYDNTIRNIYVDNLRGSRLEYLFFNP